VKHYVYLILGMMISLLLLFGLAQLIGLPILLDPRPWFEQGSGWAAIISTGLLIADILLPVPSSLIMIANGAYFGLLPGMILSTLGGVAASAFGYLLGSSGAKIMNRFIPQEDQLKATALLQKWGSLTIIVTRPIPILSETVSLMAGVSAMKFHQFLFATVVGTLPATLMYAITGATALNLDSTILIFLLVLFIAGLFWIIGMMIGKYFPALE
jgi:uncharacterized membrane protein YdjX (TVP38/TMEM64 family)